MTSQPPIVVGYDPQSRDRATVQFGVAAARFTGAPLIVVSVCHGGDVHHAEELPPDATAAHEELRAELDVPVDVREVKGSSAARALHEVAEAEAAELLVVGSTHRGSAGRVLAGSTAERLMHGAPCSVAVVPHGWEPRHTLDPIGVGFTATEEGRQALQAAHALATKAGAHLRVLTVAKTGAGVFATTEATHPDRLERTDRQDVVGLHKVEAERRAREAVASLGNGDVDVDAFVEEPADALVRASENLELLVCGSRGYGPVRAVLLGGVTRRVVAEAHCPVIVLPRGVHAPLDALTAAPGTIATG
jgi:nucleotide-binding universal stress UspA family protein